MNRDDILQMVNTGKITLTDAIYALKVEAVFVGSDYNLAYRNALSMTSHVKDSPNYDWGHDIIVLKET